MLKTGLPVALTVLGLFAISQVLKLTQKTIRTSEDSGRDTEMFRVDFKNEERLTRAEKIKLIPLNLYLSVISVLVGILPGAGGNIASFLGYSEAKRLSKDKEKFGKGCIEGIAAAEVSNNACSGGAMIPTMTLGIPGSGTAALLLSALMIHGFTPGFSLFTDHADTTYPIIFGFFVVNVLMYFAGSLFVHIASRIVTIPDSILNTIIIVLVVVGGYSLVSGLYATRFVAIMFLCGLVGYIFEICDYSGAGLTLGMVLGPMAEKGLRRAMVMSRGDFWGYLMGRPTCVALMVLTVCTLCYPFISKIIKAKKA